MPLDDAATAQQIDQDGSSVRAGAPLHPGLGIALRRFRFNDGDVVKALKSGELASPAHFINGWYFRIRISGVGLSFRPAHKEHVWRQPAIYLNQEFLDRTAGLVVIWEHPPKQVLDSEEFAKRIVGTVVSPAYIAGEDGIENEDEGDQVWGIARILDAEAAKQMRENQLSTSPAVLLTPGESEQQNLKGGEHLLVEGSVMLLDHVAICASGVWDKAGPPTGIDIGGDADPKEDATQRPNLVMADSAVIENKFSAVYPQINALMAQLDVLCRRMSTLIE